MKIALINDINEVPAGFSRVYLRDIQENDICPMFSGGKQIDFALGHRDEMTLRKLFLLPRQIVAVAKANRIKKFILKWEDWIFPHLGLASKEVAEVLSNNLELANFEFIQYKTPPTEGWNFIEEVLIIGQKDTDIEEGMKRGQIIAEEMNKCRILADTPGGDMTPRVLGEAAMKGAEGLDVKVKVLGVKEIAELKMGAMLGVSKGSVEEPRFIVMEYWGGGEENPIVLVGKGVTFDSGGLNLKPAEGSIDMHMDMSGGSAVIHAVLASARLRIKKNIIGLVPAAENMVSGSSYHPGDILKTMSGKTVEVLNTDAEGRLILADALTYAKNYFPRLVVDVATLTGASMIALGLRCSAILTKDKRLEDLFRELGERTGDYVWPLPLWDEYEEDLKATFADIANIGKTKYGGAILGAMFLYQFAKDFPWIHIDIAPRMAAIEGDCLGKGGIGTPIRLLIRLLELY